MAGRDLLPLALVEVIPRSLPFRRPYVTARGRLGHRDTLLLRIRSLSGITGWGEAVPLSLRGGETPETVAGQIRTWGEAARLAGSFEDPRLVAAVAALGSPARCAVETAVADLQARHLGIPLHQWLSGSREGIPEGPPEPVLCNATLTSGSPREVALHAEDWAADGFTVFKLKLGPEGDTGQAAAVREALGPEVKIRLDVNACWTVSQAEREIRALEEVGLELVEQPVATLEEMARLRELVPVPLVADESVSSEAEARRAAELGACDAVAVKLSKIGGLDSSLGGHLPTYLSSALDGPVGIAAAVHVAIAARDRPSSGFLAGLAQGLATQRLFHPRVSIGGPTLDGPWLAPPPGSGLGFDPTLRQ